VDGSGLKEEGERREEGKSWLNRSASPLLASLVTKWSIDYLQDPCPCCPTLMGVDIPLGS
jgi:hypothetical protein